MRDYAAGGLIETSREGCYCGTPIPCQIKLDFLGFDKDPGKQFKAVHVPPFTFILGVELERIRASPDACVVTATSADDEYVRVDAINGSWVWRIQPYPEAILNVHGNKIGELYNLVWPD